MSATHGLNGHSVQSSAEIVQQQIQGVSSQIGALGNDLTMLGNEVRNLVNELSATKPPPPPGSGADDAALASYQQEMTRYQQRVASIRSKIDVLNSKSQQVANKIGELQTKLSRLETGDLPDAQRRDTARQEQELKAAREQYEGIAKSLDKTTSQTEADIAAKRDAQRIQMRVSGTTTDSTAATDTHMTLRVQWRNTEIKIDQSSDLKTLVSAFSLGLGVTGDGSDFARRANPAVAMPYTPANGLPPIDTP